MNIKLFDEAMNTIGIKPVYIGFDKSSSMVPLSAKERAAERHLRARYNLSLADRRKMLAYQKGCCAICGKPSEHFKKGLHVDHDHSTKLVRGLLCFACNSLIPNRKNLGVLLRKVMAYLDNPPAVRALGLPIYANKIKRKKRSKK